MGRVRLSQKSAWFLSLVLAGSSLGVIGGMIMLAAPDSSKPSAIRSDELPDLVKTKDPEQAPSWGYVGPNGPEFWPSLDNGFGACGLSEDSSPVDLIGEPGAALELNIEINKPDFVMVLRNAGPIFEGRIVNQAELLFKDRSYFLTKLIFHTPSEHSFLGQHLSGEIQFFFESDLGDSLAMALLIKEGREHSPFAALTTSPPENFGEETLSQEFNLNEILSLPTQSYYQYLGSSTTPPCRPRLPWIVLTTPIDWSRSQIESFYKVMGKNNRPVQSTYEG